MIGRKEKKPIKKGKEKMNILREMIRFLTSFKSYSIKRLLWLFFALTIGFSLFGFSFVSCAPGIDEQASGDGDGDDGDGEPTRRRRDDDDDEDDGDKCRGNESCERVCEAIYEDYSEQTNCMDEGDLQVGRLEKVHNLLMKEGRDADEVESDLQELSAGEEDVDINHFEDYLKLGTSKWVEQIKKGLGADDDQDDQVDKFARLIETLKWLVKDKEVAEILSEVDSGENVLKELLLALDDNGNGSCIGIESEPADVNTDNTDLWSLAAETVTVKYWNNSSSQDGTAVLDNAADGKLYKALSCQYSDANDDNVFSYAADRSNESIFNMAFDLLAEICNVETKPLGQDKACARALICWTAEKDAGGDPDAASNSDFWELAENRKNDLEENSDSDYNDCSAEKFKYLFQ